MYFFILVKILINLIFFISVTTLKRPRGKTPEKSLHLSPPNKLLNSNRHNNHSNSHSRLHNNNSNNNRHNRHQHLNSNKPPQLRPQLYRPANRPLRLSMSRHSNLVSIIWFNLSILIKNNQFSRFYSTYDKDDKNCKFLK